MRERRVIKLSDPQHPQNIGAYRPLPLALQIAREKQKQLAEEQKKASEPKN